MRTLAKWMLMGAVSAGAIPAYADNYSILFTDTSGSGVNATGTFSYSGGRFSNFDVRWDGLTFVLTADANSVTGVGGCSGGAGASTFNYLESAKGCGGPATQWGAAALGIGPGATFLFSPSYAGFGRSLLAVAPEASSMGTFAVTDLSHRHAVPEIDRVYTTSALALLVGGLLVLRGRRPRGRTA
jgi:hypothetical protein